MHKKELLTKLDDRQAEDLETYITSDSMWSPVTKFIEEKGLRDDSGSTDFDQVPAESQGRKLDELRRLLRTIP